MGYPTYLVHFNKNHDRLGRFDTGDGDGDGQTEYQDKKKKRKVKDKLLGLKNAFIEGMREEQERQAREAHETALRIANDDAMRFTNQVSQQNMDFLNQESIRAGQNFTQQQLMFNQQQQMWF